MKKLLLLLVLAGLACPCACRAQDSGPQKSASGIECTLRFNERLRVDAWEWSNTFNVGDPIWFDAILKNTSQSDVVINSSHYNEGGESGPAFRAGIDPVLLDAGGREVRPLRHARFKTSGYRYALQPEEEVTFSFYLGDWYNMKEPGSFSLYLRFVGLPGIDEAASNRIAFEVISGVRPQERDDFARVTLAVIALNPTDPVHLRVSLDGEVVLDEKFNAIDVLRMQENQRELFFNLKEGKHLIQAHNPYNNILFEEEFEVRGTDKVYAILDYSDSSVTSEDTKGTLYPPDSFIFEVQYNR